MFVNSPQAFNVWGTRVLSTVNIDSIKAILKEKRSVTIEEAIFRSESFFKPANLLNHLPFWSDEILKDHPHKHKILEWLAGVKIEQFLNSFTSTTFQGERLNSYYPQPKQMENYVPQEFYHFMNEQVQEWVNLGVLKKWEDIRKDSDMDTPWVVCPLGVEPNKPRAIWDGRYVNEFCGEFPFHMDNAAKVAEVAWSNAYFFKLDHKNGYLHIPIHEQSRKFFGVFWNGVYYVLTVLPFGWKISPLIYRTVTEALAMYIRSLGIPMLCWIDDMLGMTEQSHKNGNDEEQFQSALRSMVVTTHVLFKAGYFLGIPKCNLIPEKVMVYLGIECDSLHCRFLVPENRVLKYLPILKNFVSRQWVSFSDLEKLVGKLVSLESAVPAGMWYTREQYSALRKSGISPVSRTTIKQKKFIKVTPQLLEEWNAWICFLTTNLGSPWKKFQNVMVQAEISSDASGRSFAGVVDFVNGPTKITANEFHEDFLQQDIQVKEGEALRATLSMLVSEFLDEIQGKTLVCKVDNQVLKAVLERKGTSQNLVLNNIGKQIYWLQFFGGFHVALEYVRSEENRADKFTRESPGLEASISHEAFMTIWNRWGPFQWDIMASATNVNRDPKGIKLRYFSRYYDPFSKGVNVFAQDLTKLEGIFCFPPIPIIGMVVKYLEQQKVDCVLLIPAVNSPWVNLISSYIVDLMEVAAPYDHNIFSVLNNNGKRIPKKYPHSMIAVKLQFSVISQALNYLHV